MRGALRRIQRALGAPLRQWRDESTRSFALATMRRATRDHGPGARLLETTDRRHGGVAIIETERGVVQAFLRDGALFAHWLGRPGHPVGREELTTEDLAAFTETVRRWASRHFVHQRLPDAGPHHMLI